MILLLFAGLPGAFSQLSEQCPQHRYGVHDYENPLYSDWLSAYDVKSYDLDLSVSNVNTIIEGSAEILLELSRKIDTLVFELQDGLDVDSISMGDQELDFEHRDGVVYIFLKRTFQKGEYLEVKINYGGDAGRGGGFFSGISSRSDYNYGFDVTYTLSEPMNASDWFPVKQVLEDKIDSVKFSITCDRALMAGSNGILLDVSEQNNKRTFTWKTAYPMAYYLISFAVAEYRDYSFYAALSDENDSVLVQNFIYDSDEVYADWKEDIEQTAPMITAFSELLIDYPFAGEKYGHCMAPMGGGMEHQTMTTIHNFDFFLVAHELGHQWFGDYITCGNWQDIWINEGFASYMEYVAAQVLLEQADADQWMNNAMSLALQRTSGSVYVPEEDVEETARLFDYGLTYKKGAILLHMIRFILEDDNLFFHVLETYLEQYGNGLARGSDFQALLEAESQLDFSAFFQQWYYGEGFPRFKIYWHQDGDSLKIRSEQSATAPEVTPLFQLPFELEVLLDGGEKRRVRLMQQSGIEEFSIAMDGRVLDVRFDPDNDILETSSVLQELPVESTYRYGPNPVSSELFLQFPNAGPFETVRITNMSAQEVLLLQDLENPAKMDLSSLAEGSYLLEFSNSRGTFKEHIVKVNSN